MRQQWEVLPIPLPMADEEGGALSGSTQSEPSQVAPPPSPNPAALHGGIQLGVFEWLCPAQLLFLKQALFG